MVVTSPDSVVEQNYRVTANYFLSIVLRGGTLELCFPIESASSLVCFKISRFISENDFRGVGWIENCSKEKDVKIIVPPYRPGFFIGTPVFRKLKVEAYYKIFWEIPMTVETLKVNWSDSPAYYVATGNGTPSIAFRRDENGYFIGIGDTPDRAVLNTIHLSRIGVNSLETETNKFMDRFNGVKDKVTRDNILMSIFNSNSIFIDKEDNCIMASKSPKYYVSSGFWARDFVFWVLPIIERYDTARAKELLSLLLKKYWNHKGTHALYLDGRILYDGFELDQLSYYFIALERAIAHKVIEPEDSVVRASHLMDALITRKSDQYHLYSTDLNSSDDPVTYPYVTFNNVALWYSMRTYGARIKELLLDKSYLEYSDKIREDIMKEMVSNEMFCYSTDLNGNNEFYDDPTGSLLLLPFLGFVDRESRIFKNTFDWIKSNKNEYKVEGRFSGIGNRHVKHPWVHSYVTEVLSGLTDKNILEGIPLDDGLSCETIDENDGKCHTGIHFPGSSAFLVRALMSRSGK
jgi:hypothetical protein